ncbi:MAG: hypothetical protein ACM3II_17870 [Rhodospirillaceae bacterium]
MAQPTLMDLTGRSAPQMAKKWMQKAVRHPGALTAKAHAAGESPMEFARSHAHAPGQTGRQARFALIAQHETIPKKTRRQALYDHPRSPKG